MESSQRDVCNQSEGEGEYTLARDAILRGAQITSNGFCPLITCQSFGLDKKLSNRGRLIFESAQVFAFGEDIHTLRLKSELFDL